MKNSRPSTIKYSLPGKFFRSFSLLWAVVIVPMLVFSMARDGAIVVGLLVAGITYALTITTWRQGVTLDTAGIRIRDQIGITRHIEWADFVRADVASTEGIWHTPTILTRDGRCLPVRPLRYGSLTSQRLKSIAAVSGINEYATALRQGADPHPASTGSGG